VLFWLSGPARLSFLSVIHHKVGSVSENLRDLVAGVCEAFCELGAGGFGAVRGHCLLGLGGEIFAAEIRHVDC
jgi:hypothetical protein